MVPRRLKGLTVAAASLVSPCFPVGGESVLKILCNKITALAMCLVLALCLVALPGCNTGETTADVISTGLSSEIDQIVNQQGDNWDALVAYIQENEGEELQRFGVSAEDFASALFDGFEYEITDVDVDEDNDTAEAHVELSCKSMIDFNEALTATAGQITNENSSISEDELCAKLGEVMVSTLNGLKLKETTLDITVNRDEDGVWDEAESVSTVIANAILS